MANGTQIVQIDPSKLVIVMDKSNVLWDERALLPLDKALASNIGYYGVREPVLITANNEVIDGRQRVKALIRANEWRKEKKLEPFPCPCIVQTDVEKFSGVMIATNELRKEDDPMTKARKVKRFIEEHGSNENVLSLAALTFGVTKQTIENYTRILSCSPEVQKAVENGTIKSTVALQWYKLPTDQQAEKVKEATEAVKAGNKVTVNKANPNKGAGRGGEKTKSRAKAGDMRRKDEVCKLLASTVKEWNEMSGEQQAKNLNNALGVIDVLGWMLHDEAAIDEDATDALKKKGSKKVIYSVPDSVTSYL